MTQKYRVVLMLFALSILVSNSSFVVFAQTGDIDSTGSVPASCITLSTSLRYKDTDALTGGAVSSLQEFLIAKGYMNTEATGFFGSVTFASVQKYQAAKGLTTSGFVGNYTRAAIKADSCNGAVVSTIMGTTNSNTSATSSSGTVVNAGRTPKGYIVSQGNNGNTCSIILGRSTCAITISWLSSDYAFSPQPVALTSCESSGGGCNTTEERYEGASGVRSFTLRNGVRRIFSLVGYDFTGNLRKAIELVLQTDCSFGSVWNGSICVASTGAGYTAVNTTAGTASTPPTFTYDGGVKSGYVTFKAIEATPCDGKSQYTIDYGDNTPGDSLSPNWLATTNSYQTSSQSCGGYLSTHTYTKAGTYTAKLFKKDADNCSTTGTYYCTAVYRVPTQVGILTVTIADLSTTTPCFVIGPSTTCAPTPSPTSPQAFVAYYDVKGDGRILTSMVASVKGGGPTLKACSGQVAARFVTGPGQVTPCSTDADFVYLKNQAGWSYNPATDIYSFSGSIAASGFPDTTYFTNFILSNGTRETKMFGTSIASTVPAIPPSTTPTPCFVVGPGAACSPTTTPSPTTNPATTPCFVVGAGVTCPPSTYVTPPSTSARVAISNSSTGPFTSSAYNQGKIYSQLTGLSRTDAPKGCAQPAGLSSCLNSANFRNFTSSEWINDTTVVTSLDGGTIPSGYYDSYIMYPGQSPIKVGSFTISAPVAATTFTANTTVQGNGSILTTLSSTITGGGSNLRACTARLSGKASGACSTDAEFAYLRSQSGWAYDSTQDQYSYSGDVSSLGYPDTAYFSVYILGNGSRVEKIWGTARATAPFTVNLSVTGNGSTLQTMTASVAGGGPNLRACTALLSGQSSGACSTDAEFAYLKSQSGWVYDASQDVYSFSQNIASFGYPDAAYFTNYILSDGTRVSKVFNQK